MITQEQADAVAKAAYGSKGFCSASGEYRRNEAGEWECVRVTGYNIGYHRTGKPPRRSKLSTIHGWADTPGNALVAALTSERTPDRIKDKMSAAIIRQAAWASEPQSRDGI